MGLLRRQLTSHLPLLAGRGRLWLALSVALLLLGLFAAGCSYSRPAVDPYAELRQSWRPGYEMTTVELEALPVYSMTLKIDPSSKDKAYAGSLDLTLPVTGSAPLRELYFRTYPNLFAFGGNLRVTGAKVNGTTVNFGQAAESSAVHLSLPDPLEPGTRAKVWLSFSGDAGRESKPGDYTIFGANEDVLSLTNFYPILAARRGDAWALDIPHPQGDVGFHDAALYRVEITTPPGQTIIGTGTEITHTVGADGWVTTRYVEGPAREFTALISPRYQVTETETLGTRIRSYYYPEDADAGREALRDAAAALQVYSDRYGSYPYRDMAIVAAPLTFHGMEFPGVSLIGSQDYNLYRKDLETLVVHEVAHQWWYNQVGSDQIMNPWLDEGLAEFSMYNYFAARYGEPRAQQLRELRWQLPVASLQRRGKDAPIGLPVRDYKENYETLVYGKGAEFFATLRDELGPATFDRLLRTYLERYRWRIATPAEFRALAEEVSGKDLGALFGEWVEGAK
jgi:aminopeptidase N